MGTSFLSGNTTMHAALWRDGNVDGSRNAGRPEQRGRVARRERSRVRFGDLRDVAKGPAWARARVGAVTRFCPITAARGIRVRRSSGMPGTCAKLPTLGGNNGYGAGMNEGGEIAGWAETKMHDSTCVAPQVLQFLPAVWNAMTRKARALPTLTVNGKTDPDGAATAVNREGRRRRHLGHLRSGRGAFHGAPRRAVEERQADRAADDRRDLVEHADGDQRRRADRRLSQPTTARPTARATRTSSR